MRMKAMISILVLALSALNALAQTRDDPPQPADRPPRREDRQRSPRTEEPTLLTPEQNARVKAILSKYNESSLTASDARAINDAFRDAGLRNGPGLQQAIRDAGFTPETIGALAPPPDRPGGERTPPDHPRPDRPGIGKGSPERPGQGKGGGYSIEQAISDQAQLGTIAFSGLAFLTGDFGSATFIPPGKVSDFFGFQYMRDIDAAGKGHNPMFLDRIAGNVMGILSEQQRRTFEEAAREQEALMREIALKRFPLIAAFHRELAGNLPPGTTGLDRKAVVAYGADLFALDATLAYRRAKVFGPMARSLTSDQKQALGRLKFGDFNTWPDVDREAVRRLLPRGASKLVSVGYMTLASEFFSWYAGSVEADTYFCPERHGTYFGGFYLKDMPAMGRRDYDISTSLTGDAGAAFLDALNASQRSRLTGVLDRQRKTLGEIVEVRRAICTRLRRFLRGEVPAEQEIIALGRRYGELDGELAFEYATAFNWINRALDAKQKEKLRGLRPLQSREERAAFLYSDRIPMPKVPDSAFLFGPKKG